MHAAFMIYGHKQEVDNLIIDILAQKFILRGKKSNGKIQQEIIQCGLRISPFGIYEVIFPEEYKDLVLTALNFHHKDMNYYKRYGWKFKSSLLAIRKILGLQKIPEFKTDKKVLWNLGWCVIIPIGVRYDSEITELMNSKDYITYEGI